MGRPNILIVMADQMTAALTGAYGHPLVRTPALAAVAARGVRFDAAYSPCPLCTPARAAMFSGRYVSRTGTYDNGAILPADVATYAHHLRAAGYEVAAAGKLHFIGPDQLHGLERRLTPDIYPADFDWTPADEDYDAPDDVSCPKAERARDAGCVDGCEQIDYDDGVHAAALRFLGGRRDAERPFALLVSYSHPHPPYRALRRFWDMYDGVDIPLPELRDITAADRSAMEKWLHFGEGLSPADAADEDYLRRIHRAYYAMVSYVDEKLGELLAAVEAAGLAGDTAVLFCADHGDMLGQRRLLQKRCFYEWSARIPLVGSFPGRWAEGAVVAEPVSLLDVFPTLVDLAGAEPATDIDGESLLGVLTAGVGADPERIVFSEYEGEWVPSPCFMARRGRHKYVYAHGAGATGTGRQLFDLESDPLERENLVGDGVHRAVEADLHAAVMETFDVEAIAADMIRSRANRRFLRRAMRQGAPTRWDYRA